MPQYIQEKEFDEKLKRIGDLYEDGKDCLATIIPLYTDSEERAKLYDILHEFRNIAATLLYEIKQS